MTVLKTFETGSQLIVVTAHVNRSLPHSSPEVHPISGNRAGEVILRNSQETGKKENSGL